MTLKNLLTMRIYADPEFARAFRYDSEDIRLARQNETTAAQNGLRAEIANPFTGKPVKMRDFLRWTLEEIRAMIDLYDDDPSEVAQLKLFLDKIGQRKAVLSQQQADITAILKELQSLEKQSSTLLKQKETA